MKLKSIFILMFISFFLSENSFAQLNKEALIRDIQVQADGEIDVPRVVDLLNFKEGDAYSVFFLEQGLKRLSDSNQYQSVEAEYDPNEQVLLLRLSLLNHLTDIDIQIGAQDSGNENLDFLRADIETVIQLSRGDHIYQDRLEEVRGRVKTRLVDRGFRQAEVVLALEQYNETPERRLMISIALGSRTYVKKVFLPGFSQKDFVEFVDTFSDDTAFSRLRKIKDFIRPTEKKTELDVNVPLDWVVLNEAVEKWRLKSRQSGYYDFQLKTRSMEMENGVSLEIDLKRGDRYRVEFVGNVAYWEHDLRGMVVDKTIKLGIALNLNESQQFIKGKYLEKGFKDVDISYEIEKNGELKKITFKIIEGRQHYLSLVKVEGVSDEDMVHVNEAIDEWLVPLKNPLHYIYYDQRLFKARLPQLVSLIQEKGFLGARALDMREVFVDNSRWVELLIPVQLGFRTYVGSVSVSGNVALTDKELDSIVEINSGQPLSMAKIQNIAHSLESQYSEMGFIHAKVHVQQTKSSMAESDETYVDVDFQIQYGPKVKVGKVIIEGLRRTNEKVVLRELNKDTLYSGGVWTPDGSSLLEQRLLGLGIFGSARVDQSGGRVLERGDEAKGLLETQERDLKITIAERNAGAVEFGPGYRTDRGLIGFVETNYHNLGGWNRSVIFRAIVSRKLENYSFPEQTYSIVYLEPFLADLPYRFRISTSYEKVDRRIFFGSQHIDGYSSEEASFGFGLDRELSRHWRWVHNLYTISKPRIFDVVGGAQTEIFQIATIGTTFIYDSRDNRFNPTKGWVLNTGVDLSSSLLGSNKNAQYAIAKQEVTTYVSLIPRTVLAMAFSYKRLWALEETKSVPATRRLSMGGRNSVRAIRETLFSEYGIADQQSVETRFEHRQPILNDLGLAIFFEAGRLDAIRAKSTGWRQGIGVGLRYNTPVGPVALDYAQNVNPQSGEDPFQILFSIGSF